MTGTGTHSSSRTIVAAIAALAVIAFGTATVAVQSPREAGPAASERTRGEWPSVGGDLTNQRFSPLTAIDTETVKRLGAAWVSEPFPEGGTSRSTPVVHEGLMFVTAGIRVLALDASTGRVVWSFQQDPSRQGLIGETGLNIVPVLNSRIGIPNAAGVAVGEGLVFVGLTEGTVVALREKTGEVVWKRQTGEEPVPRGQAVSGAPVYADGLVFTGLANGDWALRGRVSALDAKTGAIRWTFFVVPSPGEPGNQTWARDSDVWSRGGGGVWLNGVVDRDLGLVYFGSGNAVPQWGGELRPGDNLYTVSVLALDTRTGKLRWHYQLVHHDIWESDIAVPLVLYDVQVGGRPRKGIAAIRTDGYLFLLDREKGTPLAPVEERRVPQDSRAKTAATQPFPVGGESILRSCDDWKRESLPRGFELKCQSFTGYFDQPNWLMPSQGVRVAPMAFSAQTGLFYATGVSSLDWKRRADDPYLLGPQGRLPYARAFRSVAAIDAQTNTIRWKKEWPVPGARTMGFGDGGLLATAGGLVFHADVTGNFRAYDAKTGDIKWEYQLGLVSRGTPSAYTAAGRQYVAIAAGPTIVAFALDGAVPPRPAPSLAPPLVEFAGAIEPTTTIETTSLIRSFVLTGGQRYFIDEFAFNPYRARAKAGSRVTWVNNGKVPHTIAALDGSWSTPRLSPAAEAAITFDKPGTYVFVCKDHPWAYGQVIVE